MSCVKKYRLAVATVFVALIGTVPQSVAATCSNASIKGQYGIFINGYDSSGLYQHGVGMINSNGAGKFTGVETVSDDGTIYNVSRLPVPTRLPRTARGAAPLST